MTPTAGCVVERSAFGRLCLVSVLVVLLMAVSANTLRAEKTDVVKIEDGNVIVGEIKKLHRGLLEYSVDHVSNRLQIKWEHVIQVTSTQNFDIELSDGSRFFGYLADSEADGVLRIETSISSFDVALTDVVMINPIKGTFWKRLDGDISAGLNYTKATDLLQVSFGGSLKYRRIVSLTEIRWTSNVSSKSDEPDSYNISVPLTHYRFFRNRWFYRIDGAASRNDELGIDFRASLGAGGGRRIIQSNRILLALSGLLVGNREFTNDGLESNNLELMFDTQFEAFRYDTPKLDFANNLAVFYGLTKSGRYRVDYDGRLSLELGIKDFFWDITQLYYRFDSDPSETAIAKDDYGIISSLRYKF